VKRYLLLFACLSLACFTGCGRGHSAGRQNLPVVKVIINSWPGLGPYYVAQAKGFDRAQGISLDVSMNEDPTLRHTALESGDADLVGITMDAVVIARAHGVPMTAVGQSDYSFGGDGIIAGKSIQTLADLKGKRIAYSPGQPSEFFLLVVLQKEHLGLQDFTKIPAGDPSLAAQMFTAGRADAAVTWDPWISQAEKLARGHVIVSTRDTPGILLGIVAANSNLLPEHKDHIYRSQKAWLMAVDYCRQHPDESAQIMARKFNVPMADFKRMAKGAQIADLAEELKTFGTRENPGAILQIANQANALWLEAGAIQKAVDPYSVVDWTIVDELRKAEK